MAERVNRRFFWLKEWLGLVFAGLSEIRKLERLVDEVDKEFLWGTVWDKFEDLSSEYNKMEKEERKDAVVAGVTNLFFTKLLKDTHGVYFPTGNIKVIITPQGKVNLLNVSKMERDPYRRGQIYSSLNSREVKILDWGEFGLRLEEVKREFFWGKISARRKEDIFSRL